MSHPGWVRLLGLFVVAGLLLSACGAEAPQAVEQEVTRVVTNRVVATVIVAGTPETIEKEVTRVVAAEPVATAAPVVGGALVIASGEPETLDPHHNVMNAAELPMSLIGATLVAVSPEGKIVPYLAESWKTSDDGLIWDFKLRSGVTFHDGSPLTAADYAWTLQRVMDPATRSATAAPLLGPTVAAEATDDLTLRVTLAKPYQWLLYNLAYAGYLQPLPRAAVETLGDTFGRQPIGTGPYRVREWATGERLILERNPDFAWGPEFTRGGAPYIETIEFRFLPEYAVALAGLAAGEIDYAVVQPQDVARIRDMGGFQIFESVSAGLSPYVSLNVSVPPFDDVRVRQAFNLAVDRQALIDTVVLGAAVPQAGPASVAQIGYWPGAEYLGYGYDLDRARALMEAAGYKYNVGGMLEKDGQPFKLTLQAIPGETTIKTAQVLQQQFKALGVDVTLETPEFGALFQRLATGDYAAAVGGITYNTVELLTFLFHSSMIGGGYNLSFVKDTELDQLLEQANTAVDPEAQAEASGLAQRRIIEQAYVVPLFAPTSFIVLSERVHDAVFSPQGAQIGGVTQVYLYDAYIQAK